MFHLQKRVEVFDELLKNGMIKNVSVDTTQTEPLLRVLDTVVIKLEGGTDDDLKILDEKPKETSYPERVFEKKIDNTDDDVIITSVEKKRTSVDEEPKCVSPRPINRHKNASDDEENWDDEDNANDGGAVSKVKDKPEEKKKKSLKRKRTSSDSSSSSSSDSDSSSSSSSSEDEDDEKVKSKYDLEAVKKEDDDVNMETKDLEKSQEEVEKDTPKAQDSQLETKEDNENNKLKQQNGEEEIALETTDNKQPEDEDKIEKLQGADKVEETEENNTSLEEEEEIKKQEDNKKDLESDTKTEEKPKEQEDQPETIDLDKVKDGPQPRALHRTSSIFLRNLAPSITKAEIEAICQKFDGYLRVAIADPLVERRWYRRGWVTFKRDVNIKEICWNLNNTRLRDCEMGAIVNRDLSRRVRPVNGMTAHKTIVRADIKLCAKIAMNLDEKFKLWVSKEKILWLLNQPVEK